MAETSHPEENRLRKAVATFLAARGISETAGPPVWRFTVSGTEEPIKYHAHAFGVSTKTPTFQGRTNHPGRYEYYQDIEDVVLKHLGEIDPRHRFMIWRSGPDFVVESSFLKAYLRYVTTADPVAFEEAARQHAELVTKYGR